MPMLVVLGVYISIFWRLKNRPITKNSTNFKRRRRTNIMVISVSVTFFLSWLPLNALNFLLDVESLNKHSKEVRIKRILFFVKSPNKFVAGSWNPEKGALKNTYKALSLQSCGKVANRQLLHLPKKGEKFLISQKGYFRSWY